MKHFHTFFLPLLILPILLFTFNAYASEQSDSEYLGHDHSSCSTDCTIIREDDIVPYALACFCGGTVSSRRLYTIGAKEGTCFESTTQQFYHYRLTIKTRYYCNSCNTELGDTLVTSNATYCGQYLRQVTDHGYIVK